MTLPENYKPLGQIILGRYFRVRMLIVSTIEVSAFG